MPGETCPTDRALERANPTVFLGELREGDRRRVLLDPTSKVVDARELLRHVAYGATVSV